ARYAATVARPRDLLFDENYLPPLGNQYRESLLVPHDSQTAFEFREAFQRIASNSDAGEQYKKLLRETKLLLNRSSIWDAVEALADELAKKGVLSGQHAEEILRRWLE